MIFQNDDDLYRSRRFPWGTILLSAFCFALALAIVLGVRSRLKKGEQAYADEAASAANPGAGEAVAAADAVANAAAAPAAAVGTSGAAAPPAAPAAPAAAPVAPAQRPAPARTAGESRPSLAADIPASGLLAERNDLRAKLASAAPADKPAIEARLGDVNVRLATTPVPSPHKVVHTVASGESLAKLANRYVCPVTLIQKINGLKDTNIRIGTKLYILDHPEFAIEVSRRHNTLLLTLYGEYFKRYSVCTGENGKTPLGTFEITEKETDPTWFPEGKAPIPPGQPGNILGTRWMRLEATGSTPRVRGIGIHGTTDPASIGTSASDGCIRMHNADVEEIFRMIPLNPHVPVTIVD